MNYQLEQTGEQVQEILNQAPTTEQNLQNEITRSTGKDEELETAIGNEKNRAEGVEAELQTAIGNESARAEGVEGELSTAIANEKNRAEGVEGGLRTDVDGIEAKIPTGASEQNKLATESFVNSSVATNTADFKGTFPSLEALQTEVHDANANDYAFVISTDAAGNTVYNRYKYVTGTGWVFEYALNNSSFTAAQWAAIQSGITALLVAKLTGLPTVAELTQQLNTIIASVSDEQTRAEGAEAVLRQSIADNTTAIANEKTRAQNAEGTLSTNIVSEENRAKAAEVVLQQNIDAEAILRDNADDALQAQIDDIDAKIPEQASASNQMADKSFVNSSIATNTADFKGTYNSLQELQQVSANNNDYGFVVSVDSDGNTVYNRYKYVDGTGWVFEYALNNSSFTSAQWAAIQSGITAALVAKLNGLPDITALNAMFAAITNLIPSAATSENKLVDYAQMVAALATKQNTLIFDNVPTEGSNNPVKSGGVYSAIATVTAAIAGLQSSKQDVLTFDQYPTPGSNNPVRSTGIYSSIENAVAPKANQTDLNNAVVRISTNEADIAQLQAAYRGLTQNDVVPVAPTDTWPVANPQKNVIYRVSDRTNTPPQYYTDYMWNGTVMVRMAQYNNAIDPRPKKASQNLVTSGGVFDNMGALDVSELNATENPHTLALYADLSAALAAIPTDYQKGGMSVKYVQSSDNKYVQFRLMNNQWSTNTDYWAICSDTTLVECPEFIGVWTDKYKKIIIAIENDGNVYFGAGVPKQVIEYVEGKVAELNNDVDAIKAFLDGFTDTTLLEYLNETYGEYIENPEFVRVITDKNGKILLAIKNDADVYFGYGCPTQIQKYVEDYINIGGNNIRKYLDETFGYYIDDLEGRMEIKTDNKKKIISYRDPDGRLYENVGITTNSLQLTPYGMTEFQQALKDAGFRPGGGGDWSERENIELPEPKHYALLNIVVDSLPVNDSDVSEGYVEYYDGLGNFFKMECSLEAQGQTSRIFARTGGKGNYTLDLPKDVKFGSWVPQDSFHLKGCAKDVVRGILPTSYKWAWLFMQHLDAKPNRVLMDEASITTTAATGDRITDWPTDARCLPDGFPVEVYFNGEYFGLYSWQLKKHRKNYTMDKKDYTSFFIDADYMMTDDYQHGIWNDGPDSMVPGKDYTWWNGFDIKGPKDLYCMDGSKFDGDNPQELIDSTSPYYDSSNKAHKGSQTTKNLIRSFQTKYLEVKTLINNDLIADAKAAFNANFDYNSCMLVYIYNCVMKNADSVKKNTLFGMYKSGKIFADLWDLDGMYGQGWIGNIAIAPSANLWDNTYANAEWPLKLLWDLYKDEIKAAYAELREAGVISIATWHDIVFNQWVNRIGEEAYNRDIEKWPETPSYRENYTNTGYWTEVGVRSGTGGYPVWNNSDSYAANDDVVIKLHSQSYWYMRYKAVQANTGVCPVTQFYTEFPIVGGFYDSPKRWEKWMTEQIRLCDIKNGYFKELVADFTAYRNTNPDFTIQCNDMNVEYAVSSEYQFIEGHITRHEDEVEGQTVSTYTITGGNVTEEDTSKTYTTVMDAINTASSQQADVPSENLYYIKARAKDISYHKK